MTEAEHPQDLSPGSGEIPATNPSARATDAIRDDAVRGTLWTAVQATVGLPLAIVANLAVARSLGPHGYGILASYLTAYVILLAVVNGGVSDATLQWGAAAFARGDRVQLIDLARRCAGFYILVEAPLGAITGFLLLHRETWEIRLAGAALIGVTVALETSIVVLTAMARNARLAKANLVVGVALQASIITVALSSREPGPVWLVRLAFAAALNVASLMLADTDIRRAALRPSLPRGWPRGFAVYAGKTLAVNVVTSLVFLRSELLVLDAYGDTVAAGLFALASGAAVQITAPIDAMLGPLLPAAAGLLEVGRDRAANAVLKGLRVSSLMALGICIPAVPLVALAAPLVYGSGFTEAGALFVALGIFSCLQSVLHPVTAFAVALRRPLSMLTVSAIALILDLAVVLALVPPLGATGAVIGNCIGQAAGLIGIVVLLCRHIPLSVSACLRATMPFLVGSLATALVTAAALIFRDNTTAPLAPVVVFALVAAVLAGIGAPRLLCRPAPRNDFAGVVAGIPKLGRPAVDLLSRLGLVSP